MQTVNHGSTDISLLFVEDAPVAREIISRIIPIRYPALKLHTAGNGKAGLELFKAYRPEIVITDISMPIMDGIRMATEIRSLQPDTIIIILTAHSAERYSVETSEIGVSHFIQKPIIYGELITVIDKYIEQLR